MRYLVSLSRRFIADEKAAEVTELAIVFALIVALCIVAIGALGTTVSNAYGVFNNDL